MTENDIHIEHIKVGELVGFAEDVIRAARPGQFVPITVQRAIAHANNPYANPEDVGLLAAIDAEGEVVGYFGILPMILRVGDDLFKTHWFTTWSVSAKVRGRGVGSELMKEALTLDLDFLIVGSVHARRVCQKFGFWERQPLPYYWIEPSAMGSLNPLTWVLRLVRKIVSRLKPKTQVAITNRATGAIDRALAPLTRQIFYRLLDRKFASTLQDYHFREVARIRPDLPPRADRPPIELHRGVEAVNWMLAYPWVLETGQSHTENLDYYFSDTRPLFRFIAVEIYDPTNNAYLGFVVFSVSQKGTSIALKTLDFQTVSPDHYRPILALAIRYGRHYRADTIEIPEEIVAPLRPSLLGRLVLLRKTRIYQCHPKSEDSPLGRSWQDIQRHLYDGDMAFS
jgi:hypothetical protein